MDLMAVFVCPRCGKSRESDANWRCYCACEAVIRNDADGSHLRNVVEMERRETVSA